MVAFDVVKLPQNDLPQAIAACELMNVSTDEKRRYFIIGSGVEDSTEDEPKEGYIRVYEILEAGGRRKLSQHTELKVAAGVYCIDECDGKLICGVGGTVSP